MKLQQNLKIGGMLLEQGLITEAQLNEALAAQKFSNRRLGEILIDKGIIEDHQLLAILSRVYHLPIFDFKNYAADEKLLSLFPFEMLKKHKVLPCRLKTKTLSSP